MEKNKDTIINYNKKKTGQKKKTITQLMLF